MAPIASSSAAALAGLEVFKLLVKDIYALAKETPGVAKAIWTTKHTPSKLYAKASNVKKVHTLLHLDKAVDLRTFYTPLHVATDKVRFKASTYSDFHTDKNILIGGLAGQGKSIFLRHLCLTELEAGLYLPLFIELRYITETRSITDLIKAKLEEFDLHYSEALFAHLARSGKLMLLLDAFDEVPDTQRADTAAVIDQLAAKHEQMPIVVTTRPNTELYNSVNFDKYSLSDLKGDEHQAVIKKLISDSEIAGNLIRQVGKHKQQISGLLATPLLVTLLVVTYRSFQEIPAQMSGFYEDLFQLLLQRHDGMKLKYSRTRSCQMNDAQYRQTFEAFCFFTKVNGKSVFTSDEISLAASRALKECAITCDPTKYVTDIVKITCLLLKDGNEYRFIHKSVQEYYAASFLRKASDVVATQFYLSAKNRLFYQNPWANELRFLSEIDEYRYTKFYILLGSEHNFSMIGADFSQITGDEIKKSTYPIISELRVTPMFSDGKYLGGFGMRVPAFGAFGEQVWGGGLGGAIEEALKAIDATKYQSVFEANKELKLPDDLKKSITIKQICDLSGQKETIEKTIEKWAHNVATRLVAAQKLVVDRDNFTRLNDVFDVTGITL